MANLTTNEKQILEKLFQMNGGYVLNFSDRTMQEFFRDDLKINIFAKKFMQGSGSKANYLRGFWLNAEDKTVGNSILKLIEYIENQIIIDNLKRADFPVERIDAGKSMGIKLLGAKPSKKENKSQATFKNGNINIGLQKEIFDHVQKLLNDGHYFNAVEEAYKVVRKKLKEVSGKEKAHTPARDLDKNLAIHYIALASLSYDLINRK